MKSSNTKSINTIKAYLRLTNKLAKIIYPENTTQVDKLYQQASKNYNFPIKQIHLFYQGKLLSSQSIVNLQQNAIIHIVRCKSLKKDKINIIVKIIGFHQKYQFTVKGSTIIGKFIEDSICCIFQVKITEVLLVYLGKKLELGKTFQQQQVEDGSQILCLSLLNISPKQQKHNKIERSDSRLKIPIKNLQTPQPPKDIYPKSDFTINIPQNIQQTNSLNLIFDSKVKRASSIQNVQLPLQEIIPQQQSNFQTDYIKGGSQSYKSLQEEQENKKDLLEEGQQQNAVALPKQSEIKKSNQQRTGEVKKFTYFITKN